MTINFENAIAIDTETTGLYLHHGCRAFMVIACDYECKLLNWQFGINPFTRNPIINKKIQNSIFETLDKYDTWIFHNSLFDMTALRFLDSRFTTEYFETKNIHDTMIMAHTHRSNGRLALKPLSLLHVHIPESDESELGKAVDKARRLVRKHKLNWQIAEPEHPHLIPLKKNKSACDYWLPAELAKRHPELLTETEHHTFSTVCLKYGLTDVERTMALAIFYDKILNDRDDYKYYDNHRRVIVPTYQMQNYGFPIKIKALPKTIAALKREIKILTDKMKTIVGNETFNPASGQQIAKFLYEDNKITPPKWTESGNPSTNKESLLLLSESSELSEKVSEFISLKVTHSKFVKSLSAQQSYARHNVNGRLYGSIKIPGTKTLRYSMEEPNTQNVSKLDDSKLNINVHDTALTINLRKVFGPPEGHIWFCIDYTQLQLRIFAKCCEDEFLLQSFRDGKDMHDTVAKEVFKTDSPTSQERRAAKGINFGIIFGAGARKIESMTGVPGSYAKYKERFPLVDQYIKQKSKEASLNGFIRTRGGYPLQVEKKLSYKACNIEVQGTEGELVKNAICDCHDYLKDKPFKMIMVVHDELIFESRNPMTLKEAKHPKIQKVMIDIQKIMNGAAIKLGVYTTTDIKRTSTTWAECN